MAPLECQVVVAPLEAAAVEVVVAPLEAAAVEAAPVESLAMEDASKNSWMDQWMDPWMVGHWMVPMVVVDVSVVVVVVPTKRGMGSGRHVLRCVPMDGPPRSRSHFVP